MASYNRYRYGDQLRAARRMIDHAYGVEACIHPGYGMDEPAPAEGWGGCWVRISKADARRVLSERRRRGMPPCKIHEAPYRGHVRLVPDNSDG